MIVTCEQCETQFQLDDERVPERGVRVRCSRCKHAFFVKPPRSAGDPVDSAVEQALVEDDARETEVAAEGPSSAPGGLEDSFDDSIEESDWTFNDEQPPDADEASETPPAPPIVNEATESPSADLPAVDEGLTAARHAVDDLLGDSAPPDPSSVAEASDSLNDLLDTDPGLDDGTSPGLDMQPPIAELGAESQLRGLPELGADLTPDLDSGVGADLAPDLDPAVDADLGLGPDLDVDSDADPGRDTDVALDTGLALEADVMGAPDPDPAPEPTAAGEELGSPENWEFFGDAESAPAAPAGIAIGRMGSVPAMEALPVPIDVGVDAEPSPAALWLGRVVHGLGWLLVAGMAAGALAQGLGAVVPGREDALAQRVGAFEAREVSARWVENAVAGPILVVAAELSAPGERIGAPGTGLAVRFMDAEGRSVGEAAAVVGPALATRQLREGSPEALRAELARGGSAMAWAPLRPRDRLRVNAIVSDVPEAAARFELAELAVEPPPAPEPPAAEVPAS